MSLIKYSFIIPVKEVNDYIRETIPKILEIDCDEFEIIVYPDKKTEEVWPKTRQISSGPGGPAMKRNLGQDDAKGEFLVFLDDDSYPQKDFLNVLEKDFDNPENIAVGGPAVTPSDDNFWQKVSGAVFLSRFSGGFPERYVPMGKKRLVDDWPTVNLSVRKSIFTEVNGFDSEFWPGEDTKFCADLLKKTGKKILYNPELVVFHHRRVGLAKHLKQIGGYGLHRGFFAKRFPETSRRFVYFIPSIFVLSIFVGGWLSFYSTMISLLYAFFWFVYGGALLKALLDIRKFEKNIYIGMGALYYIFFTHIVYGLRFLQGLLFTNNLRSKLR